MSAANCTNRSQPVHENDRATALALFHANQGLAHWIAKSFHRKALVLHVDAEDILQAALMGLWRAAVLFDDSRGFRFCTYATPSVIHAITKLFDQHQGKSVPAQQLHDLREAGLAAPTVAGLEPDVGSELVAALKRLNPRKRRIVRDYFGLTEPRPKRGLAHPSAAPQTLEVIARRHGVSRQAIHQTLKAALADLWRILGGKQF